MPSDSRRKPANLNPFDPHEYEYLEHKIETDSKFRITDDHELYELAHHFARHHGLVVFHFRELQPIGTALFLHEKLYRFESKVYLDRRSRTVVGRYVTCRKVKHRAGINQPPMVVVYRKDERGKWALDRRQDGWVYDPPDVLSRHW